jgi:tetratricopeptide (TPR) repeat protein
MGGYLAGHAEDFEAQRERLDWMLQLGQQGEAAKLYATYAADRPESAPAQLLAGIAHGKTEEGAAHLQRALELDPSMTEARRLLDGTLAALHPKTPAPAPRPTRPAPTPPADNGALAARIESIRGALQRESFSTARSAIESARKELAGDATARRNLDLWEAICTFQEGDLSAALRRFEALNTSASYAASGFGKGTVENWIANVHVSRGNARAAVTVLDAVGPDSPDEYAKARVWEGVALASLGMDDLALRTWTRVSTDVGRRVSPEGRAAVKTAEFLTGAISEKDYRVAVSTTGDWANDMYYFLGFSARRAHDAEGARDNFQRSLDQSRGKEFPYYLSRAEMDGTGLTGEW